MTVAQTVAQADEAIKAGNNQEGERILKSILTNQSTSTDDAQLKEQEAALLRLGGLYRDTQNAEALAETVRSSRTFMSSIAKAKTAKLVRTLIDYFEGIPGSQQTQIQATKENAEWAKSERRIFLKQNLETKLIGLYFDSKNYREALPLIDTLLRELKKLDDKMILTEVHLLESKVNHAISNLPKAKAALTSARTAANSIYCPPTLQAQLDMQAGVLHAEDKDYTTAYSYFFETLEGFALQEDARAPLALKYMLLCKIMLNLSDDVNSIISGKHATKYAGRDVDAMKAVAKAHEDRSLEGFEQALRTYKEELSNDPIVKNHLSALYDTLLEQNLLRVIEPYSRVEIAHIAKEVRQPVREVEVKLSQMILDKVFHGILDQGAGCLVVYDQPVEDKTYQVTLDTLKHVGNVIDSLYKKANKLS
ncbi:putative 26S proteasome non-atpase regulatory subunit Rpn6 [Mycosarcoma maydis]|uniref:26S proteasome non-atpase regulatory subunit Rpn6 n=1 Tax=Mycosarcoma maydis TaxID=5270 RepID=A0A0D1DZ94_MYCMD|nr:putative 26S proteasome non-atpase regulatory subunit Rpn6 [Ustilago maydis 521]KIS69344.1 putative 26S proteasome non-atpase regulatory subunit Rpn6 [Ustilago maydis 521]|eukprot:XP_011389062.1 putative 26S proteasome non-atpase regulatory subunit Rpn6 [Ustilago maydis 521]